MCVGWQAGDFGGSSGKHKEGVCVMRALIGCGQSCYTLSPRAQEGRDPESACAEVGAACPNSGQWDVDGSDVYHPQTWS